MSLPSTPEILYLDRSEDVERFVTSIATVDRIALDTEGASFHRYVDRVYLLQISTEGKHAIVDPLRTTIPRALGDLLESPAVEVVIHDADYDLRLLHQDYGWRVTNVFDTRIAAQLLGIRSFGLSALLEAYFGVKLDKKHQRADWSQRPLPAEMLRYAVQDTMYLIPLRQRLYGELAKRGRLEWAREEFARLEGTRWDDEDPALAFLRLKGARELSPRELAVLREVFGWRDRIARELDRSPFRIVSNEMLLYLARSAPRNLGELENTRGFPRGLLPRYGTALLEAIARGRSVPPESLPRFPKGQRWVRDPEYEARVARLRAVRDRIARELDLDPGVLCPRDRLEAIARQNPSSLEELAAVPGLRRWQVETIGKELLRAASEGTEAVEGSEAADA